MPGKIICTGFYVCTYGGGRYTSVSWYKQRSDAEKEVKRLRDCGAWQGMPPVIEPSLERML